MLLATWASRIRGGAAEAVVDWKAKPQMTWTSKKAFQCRGWWSIEVTNTLNLGSTRIVGVPGHRQQHPPPLAWLRQKILQGCWLVISRSTKGWEGVGWALALEAHRLASLGPLEAFTWL